MVKIISVMLSLLMVSEAFALRQMPLSVRGYETPPESKGEMSRIEMDREVRRLDLILRDQRRAAAVLEMSRRRAEMPELNVGFGDRPGQSPRRGRRHHASGEQVEGLLPLARNIFSFLEHENYSEGYQEPRSQAPTPELVSISPSRAGTPEPIRNDNDNLRNRRVLNDENGVLFHNWLISERIEVARLARIRQQMDRIQAMNSEFDRYRNRILRVNVEEVNVENQPTSRASCIAGFLIISCLILYIYMWYSDYEYFRNFDSNNFYSNVSDNNTNSVENPHTLAEHEDTPKTTETKDESKDENDLLVPILLSYWVVVNLILAYIFRDNLRGCIIRTMIRIYERSRASRRIVISVIPENSDTVYEEEEDFVYLSGVATPVRHHLSRLNSFSLINSAH